MSNEFSDDYVAELLKRDAKAKNKEYSFVGLSAFRPTRAPSNAPKPNTRFLSSIIRETDSHNAALKKREEAEAKARLRALQKDAPSSQTRTRHALKAERKLYAPPTKRRRLDDDGDRQDDQGRETAEALKHRRREERRDCEHKRDADSHGSRRSGSNRDKVDSDTTSDNGRRRIRMESNVRDSSSEHHRGRKHRAKSPSRASRRSRSPPSESRKSEHRHHRRHKSHKRRYSRSAERMSDKVPADGADSDPLEAIVGPLPESKPVKRGRGAHSSTSAMDARFSDTYDPSADIQPETATDKDEWGLALEEYRDRAKWKALGAERLRSAGFSDAEVSKWEKSGREKDEADVVWSKKNEAREWDRGKVVDSSGDVSLKASWSP